MQTKGKKKIIDNAGALQKKYAWKSEKTQDTKKAPQDTKKPAAVCPYAKKCGGCDYQGMSYEQQLQEKQTYVRKNIGDYCKVLPIIGMENPYHYRNKVHAVFDVERRGKHANGGRRTAGNGHAKAAPGGVISGVYKAGTHEVINIDSCEIEDELSSAIIRDIRGLLHSFKIKTYDEDTGYGLLRHVLVRRGFHSGEVMVVLVLGSPILPSKNNFVKALRKLHPEITTVVVNINDKQTSMVLGEKETVIYGKGYIEDTLCGCTFRISPKSFYQVNPVQTEILYNKAITYAGLTGKEKVIDAYCGTGTIGLIAASKAKEVIGVELNRDAVKDAVINAKRNNIKNEQFYNADAGKFMVELSEQNKKVDVLFANDQHVITVLRPTWTNRYDLHAYGFESGREKGHRAAKLAGYFQGELPLDSNTKFAEIDNMHLPFSQVQFDIGAHEENDYLIMTIYDERYPDHKRNLLLEVEKNPEWWEWKDNK
jgi:23S rRNA (uracil1939-C5)-methyltransferase